MSTTSTSQSSNQPTDQAKEALRARLKKSLEVAGQPADAATISRIVNARPQPTSVKGSFQPRPFSLLR